MCLSYLRMCPFRSTKGAVPLPWSPPCFYSSPEWTNGSREYAWAVFFIYSIVILSTVCLYVYECSLPLCKSAECVLRNRQSAPSPLVATTLCTLDLQSIVTTNRAVAYTTKCLYTVHISIYLYLCIYIISNVHVGLRNVESVRYVCGMFVVLNVRLQLTAETS